MNKCECNENYSGQCNFQFVMILLMEFLLIQMNVNVFMVIQEKDVMFLKHIIFMCMELKKMELNVNVKMVFMENYVRYM